jgi:hypothetical protein
MTEEQMDEHPQTVSSPKDDAEIVLVSDIIMRIIAGRKIPICANSLVNCFYSVFVDSQGMTTETRVSAAEHLRSIADLLEQYDPEAAKALEPKPH